MRELPAGIETVNDLASWGRNRMSQSDDLLQGMIRRKILAGDLPKQHCRMTWYGPGTGGICVACEQPIAPDDVEVECDLPQGGTIRLHRRCYDLWTAEWAKGEGA